MLAPSNLQIKTVLGAEVTGQDFHGYFKSYFAAFQSPDTPKILSIYEATVERQLANYVEKSFSTYKANIKDFEPSFTSKNFTDELEDTHNKVKALVIAQYKAERKMGSIEHDKQYEDILVKDIEAYYRQWNETMVGTHNKLVELEAENQRKIQETQEKADAELRNETQSREAEKIKMENEWKDRELQFQQILKIQDKDKLETIQKIRSESLISQYKANEALRQLQTEHKIQNEIVALEIEALQKLINEHKIKSEIEERARSTTKHIAVHQTCVWRRH